MDFKPIRVHRKHHGFALVATLSLLVLLTVIALGLLGLSSVTLRSGSHGDSQAKARANARLALMIAIGELQKEMGPDMRISSPSSMLDEDPATEQIDGVAEAHWLGSYDSWGGWLNAPYDVPGKGSMDIRDTYVAGRQPMFRRWLVSLPGDQSGDMDMVKNSLEDANSVLMVGEKTVSDGTGYVRAPLVDVVEKSETTGRYAWWVGGENQKVRVDKAKRPRNMDSDEWESSHSDTAEVGAGVLPGFDNLDDDQEMGDKLITTASVPLADVSAEDSANSFHVLTTTSRGVLASVRTGHLKKDLSLLFENGKSSLPDPYRFDPGDVREPSIRPMSPEIAGRAVLPNRHFASWTRMRHFYRMYRGDSDALAPATNLASNDGGGTDGSAGLVWVGDKPVVDCNVSNYKDPNQGAVVPAWDHEDSYIRFPILTSATYILSLKAQRATTTAPYSLFCLSTPVYVFWNPYNVELRLPNAALWVDVDLRTVQPMLGRVIRNSVSENGFYLNYSQDKGAVADGSGQFVTLKPGQFRVFTASPVFVNSGVGSLVPGFNALNVGGLQFSLGTSTGSDSPRLGINCSPASRSNSLFNSQFGNTPGSFCTLMRWSPPSTNRNVISFHNHVDWLNASDEQAFAPITRPGSEPSWIFDDQPYPVGFIQLALKSNFSSKGQGWYDTVDWEQDWRCRNWIQAPPFTLGKGLYLNETSATIANTQRLDCPYEFRFGSLLGRDPGDIIPHDPFTNSAFLSPEENISAIPALEIPTAPVAGIAGFAGMRIEPGWTDMKTINPSWEYKRQDNGVNDTTGNTNRFGPTKVLAYQSGMTGPGIGNSFLHPLIPRTDVYRKLDNSTASEPKQFLYVTSTGLPYPYTYTPGYGSTDNKAYCDYWDHVLLLNDALWDDYFVSSLADQNRGNTSVGDSLAENLDKLANGDNLPNSRYIPHFSGRTPGEIRNDLEASEGYLKAAACLMVDGMFNVNSTSVDAWHALFAGIRERKVVYRDKDGALKTVEIPSGKRIALSRFNTATTDQEMTDPEEGVDRDDGMKAWSGVRFLDDTQLRKLAEKCVEQVKRRGPFLNFSEFINRRLSNDDLGVMGALQSAIDYDDSNPEPGSINYDFKSLRDFRIESGDIGSNEYETPEAAVGSRYAGIPGYVIQSDLLKPIANTLSVRDDTFRVRAYGDTRDKNGNIIATAWCEAIVQRVPEYADESDDPEVPGREINANGEFSDIDGSALSPVNRVFGRKFQIESFRWLSGSEI